MNRSKLLRVSSILGVDEAGRGPWAWPVIAGACLFDARSPAIKKLLPYLNDSKKLTEKKREEAYRQILDFSKKWILFFGIGIIENTEIDTIGIKKANKKAMEIAIAAVLSQAQLGSRHPELVSGSMKLEKMPKQVRHDEPRPQHIYKIQVDGNDNYRFEGINLSTEFIIKGDSKISQIQAASIIAKVTRDHLMAMYAKKYPEYGFEKHKWYGTALHQQMLLIHGVCPIHRKSYAPIKKLIEIWRDNSENVAILGDDERVWERKTVWAAW